MHAYYFGSWVGLLLTGGRAGSTGRGGGAGPPGAPGRAVVILMGLVGLPAYALGHVADRERRARAEVERLNDE